MKDTAVFDLGLCLIKRIRMEERGKHTYQREKNKWLSKGLYIKIKHDLTRKQET